MIGIDGRTRWTQTELRGAPPMVIEAARWELYADTLWPDPDDVASLYAPDKPLTESQLQRKRTAARMQLEQVRRHLLPPDEDDRDS